MKLFALYPSPSRSNVGFGESLLPKGFQCVKGKVAGHYGEVYVNESCSKLTFLRRGTFLTSL